MKLWESGNIDLLYGPNAPNPGDGRNATVGIEDASGTDALELGFMEPILTPNSATRITVVPTGIATGVVTDANDGSPIVGATVTAQPGGRAAETDETGTYRLRLLPGNYTLTASKDPYEAASSPATIVDGEELTVDFALNAAIASVDPDRDHRDRRLRRDDHRPDHHREHRLGRPDLGSQGAPARRDHAGAAAGGERDPQPRLGPAQGHRQGAAHRHRRHGPVARPVPDHQ